MKKSNTFRRNKGRPQKKSLIGKYNIYDKKSEPRLRGKPLQKSKIVRSK